ncbi:type IV secretory system conjugative DNA transfer family protein [Staphylococcus aureus]
MTTLLGELESKATSINKKNLVIQDFDTKCPNRNIFVVGGPGSYKSAGYVIPNVIVKNQQSIVVTDPSGEVYEKTSNIKRMQGFDVRVVNFKNFLASDRQNFFDYIDKDSDCSIVAELIIKSAGILK